MSTKRPDKTDLSSKNVKMHSIFIQEYSLNSEFNLLKNHIGPGVYVIPAAKTPFIWFGVIFIRSGIYESGIFRFRLFIPHTFPESTNSPKLIFETLVYHPQINPSTHELSLLDSPLVEWRKDAHHLWQIITYMRTVFYSISTNNAVHEEAANMYEMHREEFIAKCKNCVQNSRLRIYDKSSNDDPHYLLFDEYNSNIHEPYREMLIQERNTMMDVEDGRTISWIQDGTLESLSKHH